MVCFEDTDIRFNVVASRFFFEQLPTGVTQSNMVSVAEEVHVAIAQELGERYFHCLVCRRNFSKRSVLRHFTGQTTHAFDKDSVKHWIVEKEGWRLGNNTPMRVQLGPVLDGRPPAQQPIRPTWRSWTRSWSWMTCPTSYPTPPSPTTPPTVDYKAQEVPDSDEEIRVFAKRCPIPRSWTSVSTSTRRQQKPTRRRKRGKQSM